MTGWDPNGFTALGFFPADHAAAESGKVYASGAYWGTLHFPTFPAVLPSMALVAVVQQPFSAAHADHEFAIDWSQVVFKMLTVKGVYGRQIFETWYQMSVFSQTGLDISPVITHRFPFQEFEQAFAVAHSGRCGKVVLDWTAS
jgi:threonine dehydrogenase-like Zn-dependent dehydrogenase